ncbi:MAG: hypothetical protein PHY47_00890 [Lachnospiraceae bacterium]|nr:hypothetical protein [Lachnospiraceae bacterium]
MPKLRILERNDGKCYVQIKSFLLWVKVIETNIYSDDYRDPRLFKSLSEAEQYIEEYKRSIIAHKIKQTHESMR